MLGVDLEQVLFGEEVGVAIARPDRELVAGLVHFREAAFVQPAREFVDVRDVVFTLGQVVLADRDRVVARGTQRMQVGRCVTRDLGPVRVDAVVADVPLGEERRPRRHAQRALARGAAEPHAFSREAIDVRRLRGGIGGAPQNIRAVLVGHHHADVRGAHLRLRRVVGVR